MGVGWGRVQCQPPHPPLPSTASLAPRPAQISARCTWLLLGQFKLSSLPPTQAQGPPVGLGEDSTDTTGLPAVVVPQLLAVSVAAARLAEYHR